MAWNPRAHWGRLIAASAAVIAGTLALPLALPAPTLIENRPLAEAPKLPRSFADLAAFRRATDAWVADRFPARPHLIGLLNRARLALRVSGASQVIVGRDGWLFYDDGTHLGFTRGSAGLSDQQTASWLAGLAGRTETLAAQGKVYLVLSPPDKEAIYPELTPSWHELDPNRTAALLSRLARAADAGRVLYLHDNIAPYARWGLKVYVPHETHWTGLGAYLGYAALMRELKGLGVGEGPRPVAAFREAPPSAYGPPRNLALMLGVADFVRIDYPEFDDPEAMRRASVTWLSDRRDWTAPRVVDTGQAGKPVLLLTMDSFSTALLPFLYGDFSRIVIAHNRDGSWRPDLIARFDPDVVVTESLESGVGHVFTESPPASQGALARIAEVMRNRRRYMVSPPAAPAARQAPLRTREGGNGDDLLVGDAGRNQLLGRQGHDTLRGLAGDDILRGGRGRDLVEGGDGDDEIYGDRDDDTLSGGAGADIFHVIEDSGADVVLDFNPAEGDRVRIEPGATYTVRSAGPDTIVEIGRSRLVLRGVRPDQLPPGWITDGPTLAPGL